MQKRKFRAWGLSGPQADLKQRAKRVEGAWSLSLTEGQRDKLVGKRRGVFVDQRGFVHTKAKPMKREARNARRKVMRELRAMIERREVAADRLPAIADYVRTHPEDRQLASIAAESEAMAHGHDDARGRRTCTPSPRRAAKRLRVVSQPQDGARAQAECIGGWGSESRKTAINKTIRRPEACSGAL